MQKTSNKPRTCYRTDVNEDGTRYVVMASGKPTQADSQLLNTLKAHMRTRNAEGLRQEFSTSGRFVLSNSPRDVGKPRMIICSFGAG